MNSVRVSASILLSTYDAFESNSLTFNTNTTNIYCETNFLKWLYSYGSS